jgi:hypothetical protein
MPKPNLPARRSSGFLAALQGSSTARQVAAIQEAAFIERAHDATLRDLAVLKATDIGHVTRASMAEAADIAGCLSAYAQADPLAARAVSKIGETGIRGLDGSLRNFIKEG